MIYGKLAFLFIVMMVNFIWGLQTVLKDRANLRSDFKQGVRASENAYHEVVFSVKQSNLDKLEKLFWEVSDPNNKEKYGKFLNRQQVAELTANQKATDAITKFLLESGATITRKSRHGEYITARAKVSTWETVFNTKFYEFQQVNDKKNQPILRSVEYSLPVELNEHVETVFNTVQLPPVNAQRLRPTLKSGKAGSVTPALLNSYYNIKSNIGNSLASQSLFESLGQYYSPNDLTQFEQTYGVPVQPVAYDIGGFVSDSECVEDANNCAEANLDVQYLIAVSQVTPTTYWYEDALDSFLAWIQEVADAENPPLVHSISYGSIEDSLPKSLGNAFNTEAQKLGVQGVTILASSGDDGVANFQARSSPKECGYHPSFPASSPYVTAVGATQGPESGTAEIACTSDAGGVITTGGGFSTLFKAPSYQSQAISGYFASLNSTSKPASGYSTTGRGYPDVAMAGYNYEVIIGGKQYALSGTSASSPVVAGFVSLVNAARLKAGKPALGFINQAIYQYGSQISNDVTVGKNNCCASKVCCDEGFVASKGWDPLTGYGSVDFTKFYDIFYNL